MTQAKPTEQSCRLSAEAFDRMVAALAGRYDVYAPQAMPGRGRFSDTDVIRYDRVGAGGPIEHARKADFSAKEIVFPIVQTLLHFVQDQLIEPVERLRPAIVFLRACDVHALERLDDMFLRNGPAPDVYYQRRRERLKVALLECRTPFENCFCVSMGTNRADDYALAVRFKGDDVWLQLRDADLAAELPAEAEPADFRPEFVTADPAPVTVPDPQRLAHAIAHESFFDHAMWDEYAQRCIACGRCNTHCPTCSCFSTFDLADEDNPHRGERRRAWAGCHIDRFTDMAGGHSFRKGHGDRMRFKTLHKVHDFHQRFGRHMCVGCGRCDDHCPEYISFSRCVSKVSRALEEDAQ